MLLQQKYGVSELNYYISIDDRKKGVDTIKHSSSQEINQALLLASLLGNEFMVRTLLEAGAQVNTTDKVFNKTALHLACIRGSVPVVTLLINAGADLNHMSHLGYFAIHHALLLGYEAIVKLLLLKGASFQRSLNTLPPEMGKKLISLKDGKNLDLSEDAGHLLKYINDNSLQIAKLFGSDCVSDLLNFFASSELLLHLDSAQIRTLIEAAKKRYLPIYHRGKNDGSSSFATDESFILDGDGKPSLRISFFNNKVVIRGANEGNLTDIKLKHKFTVRGTSVKTSAVAQKILNDKMLHNKVEEQLKAARRAHQLTRNKRRELEIYKASVKAKRRTGARL